MIPHMDIISCIFRSSFKHQKPHSLTNPRLINLSVQTEIKRSLHKSENPDNILTKVRFLMFSIHLCNENWGCDVLKDHSIAGENRVDLSKSLAAELLLFVWTSNEVL